MLHQPLRLARELPTIRRRQHPETDQLPGEAALLVVIVARVAHQLARRAHRPQRQLRAERARQRIRSATTL